VSEPFQFFTVAALLSISAGLPPRGAAGLGWSVSMALAAGVFWAGGLWRLVSNV